MQRPAVSQSLTTSVVLALGVVVGAGVVSLSAQGSDPRIGTWKLNVAKSKYSPGPAPQSLTVKVEPSGQGGEKVTAEFVNADGTRTTVQYTEANFDGKDYPLTGSQFGADTFHSSESTDGRQNALTRRAAL
jgi:hypothetical protein